MWRHGAKTNRLPDQKLVEEVPEREREREREREEQVQPDPSLAFPSSDIQHCLRRVA